MRAVISVIGKDSKGIIAKTSMLLYENGINILDISQTIMQELFTMIMLVDLSEASKNVDALRKDLDILAEEMGVSINVQHEDVFSSMHRI